MGQNLLNHPQEPKRILLSTSILCLYKSKNNEWIYRCGRNLCGRMSSEIPFWDIVLGRRKQVLKGGKEGMGEVEFYMHTHTPLTLANQQESITRECWCQQESGRDHLSLALSFYREGKRGQEKENHLPEDNILHGSLSDK